VKARRLIRSLAAAVLPTAVVACSMSPCTGNPMTDPVDCVQRGVNSGLYERRVEERQAEARDKQRQVELARAENERLQADIADARARETALRARIQAQRVELDRMAREVRIAADAGRMTPGESSLAQAQLDLLRQRQAALQQANLQNREMQQKAESLEHEIAVLKASLEKRKI
jgi:hypothetical protein